MNFAPLFESWAALRCLILAHLECPAIDFSNETVRALRHAFQAAQDARKQAPIMVSRSERRVEPTIRYNSML